MRKGCRTFGCGYPPFEQRSKNLPAFASTLTAAYKELIPQSIDALPEGAQLIGCLRAPRGITAKPELVCPVEVFRRSLLPVGRIDLAVEAPAYSDSGFALVAVDDLPRPCTDLVWASMHPAAKLDLDGLQLRDHPLLRQRHCQGEEASKVSVGDQDPSGEPARRSQDRRSRHRWASRWSSWRLRLGGDGEMLHESFQILCVSAVSYPARCGIGEAWHGRNKGAGKAIFAQANDHDIHSNPPSRCFPLLVVSLQSHGDRGAREQSIVGDQVKAARTNVGNCLRRRSASRPVIGNQGGLDEALAAPLISWWRR